MLEMEESDKLIVRIVKQFSKVVFRNKSYNKLKGGIYNGYSIWICKSINNGTMFR